MPDESVRVVVRRLPGPRDLFREYSIVLDGEKVGQIEHGGTVELPTTPGPHTIRATIDWSGSPEVTFVGDVASVVNVEVRAESPFGAMADIFSRASWIDIAVNSGEDPRQRQPQLAGRLGGMVQR